MTRVVPRHWSAHRRSDASPAVEGRKTRRAGRARPDVVFEQTESFQPGDERVDGAVGDLAEPCLAESGGEFVGVPGTLGDQRQQADVQGPAQQLRPPVQVAVR